MERTMLNNRADKKESILKDGISKAANSTMHVLITKVKRPKVIIEIGNVKRTKTGLRNVFNTPSTIEANNAVAKSVCTPGTINAEVYTAIVFIIRFTKNLIVSLYLIFVNIYWRAHLRPFEQFFCIFHCELNASSSCRTTHGVFVPRIYATITVYMVGYRMKSKSILVIN